MGFQHQEGSGALFQNNKTKETQPDFKGDILINGEKVKLSAWERTSKSGNGYLSIAVDTYKKDDTPF